MSRSDQCSGQFPGQRVKAPSHSETCFYYKINAEEPVLTAGTRHDLSAKPGSHGCQSSALPPEISLVTYLIVHLPYWRPKSRS